MSSSPALSPADVHMSSYPADGEHVHVGELVAPGPAVPHQPPPLTAQPAKGILKNAGAPVVAAAPGTGASADANAALAEASPEAPEAEAGAGGSSGSSGSLASKGPTSVPGHGQKRGATFNEANLDSNEVERLERGPRMRIAEPKTPFQGSRDLSHRSPEQLAIQPQQAGAAGGGDAPMDAMPPPALLLGERVEDISAQALQRREAHATAHAEWESSSDDEDDEGQQGPKAGARGAGQGLAAHPHPHIDVAAKTGARAVPVAAAATSAAKSPADSKHAQFDSKRKHNYGNMGALLRGNAAAKSAGVSVSGPAAAAAAAPAPAPAAAATPVPAAAPAAASAAAPGTGTGTGSASVPGEYSWQEISTHKHESSC